jgi:hypothetical protein
MRISRLVAAAGLFAVLGLAASAQDPKEQPKEQPKVVLPPDVIPSPFRMYLATDRRFEPLKDAEGKPLKGPDGKDVPSPKNREGKIHCLVCEYGLNPVVAVFVRAEAGGLTADSGLGKLAKGLNAAIPKNRYDKLAAFVAFLNLEFKDDTGKLTDPTKVVTIKVKRPDGTEVEEKIEQDKEYPDDERRDVYAAAIRKFETSLGGVPNVPFGLASPRSKATAAWGVQDDDVTVVVYYHMRRYGEPWRFKTVKDLTDEKVAEILKAAEASFVPKD